MFRAQPQLLEQVLQVLCSEEAGIKTKAISSQFFCNLVHKMTGVLSVFEKELVYDEMKILSEECETEIDKLSLDRENLIMGKEAKEERLKYLRILANNLRIFKNILSLKIN